MKQRGFTLLELTIVLLILGLILGGLVPKLAGQIDQQQRQHTQQQLEQAKQALLGFAISHGRLPCPASSSSAGLESFCISESGNCQASTTPQNHGRCSHPHHGIIPYSSLSLRDYRDAWQHPLHYAVANNTINGIGQPLTRQLGIKQAGLHAINNASLLHLCYNGNGITSQDCGSAANKYSEQIPAIVYSLGNNPGSNHPSEAANNDNNRVFVHQSPKINSQDPYDDQLDWLSPHILFYQMSNAGLLP